MSEIAQLLFTVKAELRAQRLTYRDVATALKLSEVSVKRLFASGRCSLDRLAQVAALLGYTLAELAQHAADGAPRLRTLNETQEKELVADGQLLLVAVCALNHWTLADIVAAYELTEAACVQRLLKLDRLRLIDLLPGNRIRIAVARDFDWLPNGPIRQFFRQQAEGDFLAASFAEAAEELSFVHGMLTESAVAEVLAELRSLRQKFAKLHDEGAATPLGSRRGTGLFLAMREWEPAGFARLRRQE